MTEIEKRIIDILYQVFKMGMTLFGKLKTNHTQEDKEMTD